MLSYSFIYAKLSYIYAKLSYIFAKLSYISVVPNPWPAGQKWPAKPQNVARGTRQN